MKAKNLNLFEYNCISYFLIRASFIGIGLHTIIRIANQDSWLAILVTIIAGFIPLGIYYLIISDNPKKNSIDLFKEGCGKFIGGLINISLMLFTFLFISLTLWNIINFISSQYLYKTPYIAISITLAISLYYMSTKGIEVIGRVAVILFYVSITLLFLSVLGLVFQIDFNNLKPILENGYKPIFKGSLYGIAYNVLPIFLLTVIPKDKIMDNSKFIKRSILFYLITIFTLFIVGTFTLSIYGIELTKILQYPEFHLLKRLSLVGFIQRVESILSVQWILDMFILITMGIYFIKNCLNSTFKIKSKNYINFIIVVLLVIGTNYLFKNNTVGNIFILNYFPFLIFGFYLIIPTIIYLFKKIKEKINQN